VCARAAVGGLEEEEEEEEVEIWSEEGERLPQALLSLPTASRATVRHYLLVILLRICSLFFFLFSHLRYGTGTCVFVGGGGGGGG
jgi:hypothetical protein